MQFSESSIKELFDSAVKAFPNTTKRQHSTQPIIIKELRWVPFVGVNTLFIKATAQNEDKEYNPIFLFKNVDYSTNEVRIVANDSMEYQFAKISLENTDVLTRCNCEDFKWRFNYYNYLDKSLYGVKRKKYESKGGAPANPMQFPGMCKHLMKMAKVLSEAKIFINNFDFVD